ncbi:hypothetical protein KR054_012206 [Drosophila jambulina]|nr:hypothetical protein KR054_012206 [Drosophila jambulina]
MKIYKQKLRDVWLQMEEFRQWLRRDPDDSYRAHCRFCKCCVNTKISDLRAHANTKKHLKQLDLRNPTIGQLVTTASTSSPAVSTYRPRKPPTPRVKKEPAVKKEKKSSDPPVDYEQIIENLALYETEQVMFSDCPITDGTEQGYEEVCEVEGEVAGDVGTEMSMVSVVDEEMVNKAVANALRDQKDSAQVFGDFVADRLRTLNNEASEFAKDKILKVILDAASIDRAPTYS